MRARWSAVEPMLRGIFERRYFSNNGPLVRELDARFARFVGVDHAVCVTNETLAFLILARALADEGEVIVPAYASPILLEALAWSGLTPVRTDVDPATGLLTASAAAVAVSPRTVGIVGVHLFGTLCDPQGLEELARSAGVSLIFDARDAIGLRYRNQRIGSFGDAEVFALCAGSAVNALGGACITTRDEELDKKLRTMRNFHGSETFAQVPLRINGKMSEAQAGFGLVALDDLDVRLRAASERYDAYAAALADIPGVRLWPGDRSAGAYRVVIEIDPTLASRTRDGLKSELDAARMVCTLPFGRIGPADSAAFPVTRRLCERTLDLPCDDGVGAHDIAAICEIVRRS